jgi:hypothetical protein
MITIALALHMFGDRMGERFVHLTDPDGHRLSPDYAQRIKI